MILLRLYLLLGLVAHKAVWEVLKRRPEAVQERAAISPGRRLVKMAKVAFLGGIILQTLLPDILPISDDPWRLRASGAVIYSLGLALAIVARIQLGANWIDIEDARVLSGQRIVATGVYRYIRHPIYTGDLLLLVGLELALNSWLVLGVGLLALVVAGRARHEEALLRAQLPGYDAYCAATARFVPFVF
jgi:protein-S-isoprenylcysteine O-methyltransferase Ste14